MLKPVKTASDEARERCIEAATTGAVERFVITHIGRDGMRTLATPAQGRHTYPTPEAAQSMIDAMMKNNNMATLKSLFGLPLKVCRCKCYRDHFDPVGVYFDEKDIVE